MEDTEYLKNIFKKIRNKSLEKICFSCNVWSVTCHLQQQQQPQTLPLITPALCTMHYALCKKKIQTPKHHQKGKINVFLLANIIGLTESLQFPGKREFQRGHKTTLNQRTSRLIDWMCLGRGQLSDNCWQGGSAL